jgi:thymidylate synthase (FAD)
VVPGKRVNFNIFHVGYPVREVIPRIYIWAETRLSRGFRDYLSDIGVPEWETDALCEAAGRLCYRSWIPWDELRPLASNRNVGKVREGNESYIRNILKNGYGSILEHVYVSVLFRDVSRVMANELIRHRAGMSYSQESLRYVRAGSLGVWMPRSARALGEAVVENFIGAVEMIERLGAEFSELVNIDNETDFARKKVKTSLIRRLFPQGMATTILATGNLRAWRHIINMRCDESAEEEMHVTIGPLARTLKEMYPSCFHDMQLNEYGRWEFRINQKV